MKLEAIASKNLYREAAEQTERESRKSREKSRKESRRAKYFDGMQFDAFRGGQFPKAVR
jgi:hypothetical protein